MHHPRIKKLAMTLGILVMALTLPAQQFTCILIRAPDHDWTCRVGTYQFGLQGYGSTTDICYGRGSQSIPLPFHGAVAIFAAFAAVGASGFLIGRRR